MHQSNKSLVAKLLATENITVVQDNVSTASFDVQHRVLTLPMWADTDAYVKDHLIGHEVAHALYTPLDGWHDSVSNKGHAYKSFLNVVEDARIEKLIQRKYPGLRATFIRSYKHLLKTGFFGADLDQINKGKLIDRINTFFKCGEASGVRFDADEKVWLEQIAELETWEQVVELTDRLFGYAEEKAEEEQQKQEELQEEDDEEDGLEGQNEGDSADGDSGEEGEGEGEDDFDELFDDPTMPLSTREAGKGPQDELASDTDEALRNSIDRELNKNFDGNVINMQLFDYTDNWKHRVIGFKDILKEVRGEELIANEAYVKMIDDHYHETEQFGHEPEMVETIGTLMYKDWRSKNIKAVNHMVKEFEMRKSATDYARQSISKTGVIDTVKMNNYKITDDIFKKVTIVPEGKNHGFIMYLDMSGSMHDHIQQTVNQLLLLVHFTRQIGVPFRVYGFTDALEYRFPVYGKDRGRRFEDEEEAHIQDNTVMPNAGMRLLELFTEQMSKSEMLLMSKALLTTYLSRRHYRSFTADLPDGVTSGDVWKCEQRIFALGGTPFDAAITIGIGLARSFRKSHNLDVLNTIFLTDGASHDMRSGEATYLPRPSSRNYITIGFDNRRYHIKYPGDWTRTIQKLYIDATGSRTIGYMITPKGIAHVLRNIRYDADSWGMMSAEEEQEIRKVFRKDGFFCSTRGSLDQQYYIPFTMFDTASGTIEMPEHISGKGAVRNAFKKGMGNQKKNRQILTKISDMVA